MLQISHRVQLATRLLRRNGRAIITSTPALRNSNDAGVRSRPFSTEANSRKQDAVRILEVSPRDGLQNISSAKIIPTSIKFELIRRLADTGLSGIEVASFVSPKWIPQLSDGKEVMAGALALASSLPERRFRFPVLVPNMRGFERAVESGANEIAVFASASEGFSQININRSVEQSLREAEEVLDACLKRGMRARGVISCIFACPYDGPTQPPQVLLIARTFLDMGCYEVGLGDTLGVGTPTHTEELLRVLLSEIPAEKLAGHYHDTYGQAVANVLKSYDMGLRAFDSSVAGLGGCPYAQGATGNVATEDLVYMFEKLGVSTGVDLTRLAEVGEWICEQLGVKNSSRVGTALMAKSKGSEATGAKKGQPEVAGAKKESSASSEGPQSPVQSIWQTLSDDGEHRVARSGNVVKITLTRPKNGNALTDSMIESITNLFEDLANDTSVFQILLEAEGRFFCTGMDLSASGNSGSDDPKAKAEYYAKVERFFNAVQNAPQVTIAVIDQPCYGGGVGLAFCCDVRLCSSKASFTLTEVTLGLSPAVISRQVIREWGITFAREAMLSGRTIPPAELQRIGSVHGLAKSSEDLQTLVTEYLEKLKNSAPRSAAAIKQLTRLAWHDPGGEEQDRYIAQTFETMMAPGSEGEHGMRQFRKKIRKIDWSEFWAASAHKPKL